MDIKPIRTESDYKVALERLNQLFDAPTGTEESDEADVLAILVDEFEKQNYPIESPDPIEAIKIRMEEMHIRQIDLIPIIGGKNRVSEILNRKRRMTLGMIRKLASYLNLSPSLLIQEYQLKK